MNKDEQGLQHGIYLLQVTMVPIQDARIKEQFVYTVQMENYQYILVRNL